MRAAIGYVVREDKVLYKIIINRKNSAGCRAGFSLSALTAGFLSNKEQAPGAAMRFIMKLWNGRWRECSTSQIFLSWSLNVSIIERLRSIILS